MDLEGLVLREVCRRS